MSKSRNDAARLLEPLERAGARSFSPLQSKGDSSALGYCFVEGVHFDLSYTNPQEVGHKVLAIAVSQLAARAIVPEQVCVSLGLTQMLNEPFVAEMLAGIQSLADKHAIRVEVGNVFPSPTVFIVNLTLVGKKALLPKRRVKAGDLIAVTGTLGASAAGLTCLRKLGRTGSERHQYEVATHLRPHPRVKEALGLYKSGKVSSLTDLSEGLATEINGLLAESRLGAEIEESAIPVAATTHDAALLVTSNARLWALYGSEDFELLMTFPAAALASIKRVLARNSLSLTVIGTVSDRKGAVMLKGSTGDTVPLSPVAWNPLVRRRR